MKKDGYYSSGEFARMAHVTLRTVRYYDKQDILKPSLVTESGARFYTDEDFARLQQILLLKYLGFSLDDIREMTIGDSDYHFMLNSLNIQLRLVRDRIEQMQLVEQAIQDTSDLIQKEHSIDWSQMLNVDTVGALNDVIASGDMENLILVQEALQEKKIAEIAEKIERDGKQIVLIAGPSSSGKTTFSHRLSIQLWAYGMRPHPIALDDYFVNREDTPKDADGNYNFECIEAIDMKQFNSDMSRLLAGETVELPRFNFHTGRREYKGDYKQLRTGDVLVIEGIHGLNPKMSAQLPDESKFKIYISALTSLNIDQHNRISTTDGRLIRRIVRDARTRGNSAQDTIAMWHSVRRGEENNIFPYQEEADVMFNSALIYELSVIKQYAEPLLFAISHDAPEYQEAKRLLKFLDYFLGIDGQAVPNNSILREFIGNSIFRI